MFSECHRYSKFLNLQFDFNDVTIIDFRSFENGKLQIAAKDVALNDFNKIIVRDRKTRLESGFGDIRTMKN